MPSAHLDLSLDATTLTAAICDIASVSLAEAALADAIEAALAGLDHLTVTRLGNTLIARTDLGRSERVVLAGHIDTVPLTSDPVNLPTRRVPGPAGEVLWGRGTVDMKGGVAVQLRVAREPRHAEPGHHLRLLRGRRDRQPVQRAAAHRAAAAGPHRRRRFRGPPRADRCPGRGWLQGHPAGRGVDQGHRRALGASVEGHNAIHDAGEILRRLTAYQARTVEVDGLEYREALNAVLISGGIAGNVIPDRCVVTVNYRYAPSMSEAQAEAHVREVFAGFEVAIVDNAGVPARVCTCRPHRPSSRRWGWRSPPSRGGPMSRGSRRWGYLR